MSMGSGDGGGLNMDAMLDSLKGVVGGEGNNMDAMLESLKGVAGGSSGPGGLGGMGNIPGLQDIDPELANMSPEQAEEFSQMALQSVI